MSRVLVMTAKWVSSLAENIPVHCLVWVWDGVRARGHYHDATKENVQASFQDFQLRLSRSCGKQHGGLRRTGTQNINLGLLYMNQVNLEKQIISLNWFPLFQWHTFNFNCDSSNLGHITESLLTSLSIRTVCLLQKLKYPKSIFFIVVNEFCERFSFYGLRSE